MKVRALAVVLIVGLLPTIAISQSSDIKDPNSDLIILGNSWVRSNPWNPLWLDASVRNYNAQTAKDVIIIVVWRGPGGRYSTKQIGSLGSGETRKFSIEAPKGVTGYESIRARAIWK